MKRGLNNKGFFKVFIALTIVALLGFAGISFGLPYYRYFTLSARTADLLKGEVGSNVQFVREKVMETAAELNVPLNEEDVDVTFVGIHKKMIVKAEWSETVDFFGLYEKQLDFSMHEEL